ncbi:MAG: ABC transporter substrate-binding protein [Candidatus Eremiobacteraeota bacterium]|nr:ABC transporter substrate-binding protein [Candidatus Eremiobacteraeota bacterium]
MTPSNSAAPTPSSLVLRAIVSATMVYCAVVAVASMCVATQPRIVSLVPSLTEDLFAIGAGAQVVGTSQFTDYPAQAAKLPQVSSATGLDVERIVALHPDVVVGIPSQRASTAPLQRSGVRVVIIPDDQFEDIFTDLSTLGRLTGHESQATSLIERLRARTAALVRTVRGRSRPRCFVVLGVAPIFTVGDRSYIAHLIGLAGGRNAAGDLRSAAYGRYSAEALLHDQPDAIIADEASGINEVRSALPWNALRAVREARTYVLHDAAILERPGPRYNAGLAWLIERLQELRHAR